MTQPYTFTSNALILDNPERKYVLTVRDLPPDEKPREKMLKCGPDALSTRELLAALLNTGTKKEEVLMMSTRIMREYGEQSVMNAVDAKKLSEDLDIPIGKAIQIVAASELGRRFYQRNGASAAVIRTARDVFEYAKDIRDLPKEHLRGIYLNTHYKVIHDEILSIGTIDMSIIHPREVFKPALAYSAAAVVLVHNHPSGVVDPSTTDYEVTRQLVQAARILGIDLVDHVIVTKDSYASIPIDY